MKGRPKGIGLRGVQLGIHLLKARLTGGLRDPVVCMVDCSAFSRDTRAKSTFKADLPGADASGSSKV